MQLLKMIYKVDIYTCSWTMDMQNSEEAMLLC